MTTKIEIINKAYSQGRVSGLTVQPTPEDLSLALNRLESLAAEWADTNLCVGYNFEDSPLPNSLHNIPRKYWGAYESNLMMRLLADFGKEVIPAAIQNYRCSAYLFDGYWEDIGNIPSFFNANLALTKSDPSRPVGSSAPLGEMRGDRTASTHLLAST